MRRILGIAVLCSCALVPVSFAASTPAKLEKVKAPAQLLREILQPAPRAQDRAQNCQVVECDPEPSPWSCQETDNGNYPPENGALFFLYYDDLYYTYYDYCSNGSWLVEYWCNSASSWTTTNYYCTNGCSSGHCIQ